MDEHCNKKISEALKELGYPTKVTFVNHFGAIEIPVNQGYIHLWDAQKWLREEKDIIVDVRYGYPYYNVVLNSRIMGTRHIVKDKNKRIADFFHYEEALFEGIKAAVKILKEEEK